MLLLYCLKGTVQIVSLHIVRFSNDSTLSQIVAVHNRLHLEFLLHFVKQQYFFFRKRQSRRPINLVSLKRSFATFIYIHVKMLLCHKHMHTRGVVQAMGQFPEEDGTVSQNCHPTRIISYFLIGLNISAPRLERVT